jgi:putative ABC transport system substrate-binding protein
LDSSKRLYNRNGQSKVAAFEERLREHGWIDGRTITIIYRWAEGRNERFAEVAGEFVTRKVGNAVAAVRQATSTIPIILTTSSLTV